MALDGTINYWIKKKIQESGIRSIWLEDNEELYLGTDKDTSIFFDGTNTHIDHTSSSPTLWLKTEKVQLQDVSGGGQVDIYLNKGSETGCMIHATDTDDYPYLEVWGNDQWYFYSASGGGVELNTPSGTILDVNEGRSLFRANNATGHLFSFDMRYAKSDYGIIATIDTDVSTPTNVFGILSGATSDKNVWHVGYDGKMTFGNLTNTYTGVIYHDGTVFTINSQGTGFLLQEGGADVIRSVGEILSFPEMPRCRAYQATAQSIPDSTYTALAFDAENYDVKEMHDNTTNNTRITIPADGSGTYLITANVFFAANATGVRNVRITLNGTTVLASGIAVSTGGTTGTSVNATTIEQLSAGDYIEVEAYQDSGAALDTVTGRNRTYVCVHKIS